VVATIFPTRVSRGKERAGYYLTRLYEYWVPMMMMVVRIVYLTSCFLRAGYDVPLVWYGMYLMGVDVGVGVGV